MTDIFIHQIISFYTKPEDRDPAYGSIDNSANERPDWYEYWPIRKFLLTETLVEDAFYGFLSPSFTRKTNMHSNTVFDFIKNQSTSADVILLTPSLHLTAYFWNVFQYGEYCHPGLMATATQFFERIGQPTDLKEFISYSKNEVNSNYIVAKPRFWRAWLHITEQLIAIAESPNDSLGQELRKKTVYRGHHDTEMKIFILERIPTWLLVRDSSFISCTRDPFAMRGRVYKLPGAMICDALKQAFIANGRDQRYKDLFQMVSRCGKPMGWLLRAGAKLGFKAPKSMLAQMGSYWTKAGGL